MLRIEPADQVVMLLSQVIKAALVSHIDLFNSVQVILLSLSHSLSQALNLGPESLALDYQLLLIGTVLISVLVDLH